MIAITPQEWYSRQHNPKPKHKQRRLTREKGDRLILSIINKHGQIMPGQLAQEAGYQNRWSISKKLRDMKERGLVASDPHKWEVYIPK